MLLENFAFYLKIQGDSVGRYRRYARIRSTAIPRECLFHVRGCYNETLVCIRSHLQLLKTPLIRLHYMVRVVI
jgi:hypothetical protein